MDTLKLSIVGNGRTMENFSTTAVELKPKVHSLRGEVLINTISSNIVKYRQDFAPYFDSRVNEDRPSLVIIPCSQG
jgi:hypothetical protein